MGWNKRKVSATIEDLSCDKCDGLLRDVEGTQLESYAVLNWWNGHETIILRYYCQSCVDDGEGITDLLNDDDVSVEWQIKEEATNGD